MLVAAPSLDKELEDVAGSLNATSVSPLRMEMNITRFLNSSVRSLQSIFCWLVSFSKILFVSSCPT